MKTADLIPFILLELNQGDKYGFELTKEIETKSNGQIVIKQPTLYTLLKKLEKSKFITSYWQDSEIGGKRHYYKLTENGRLQVATLPSYDFLMKNALSEDGEVDATDEVLTENLPATQNNTAATVEINNIATKEEKSFSIMDELLNNKPEPIETILPTEEVFADNNIDNSTEMSLNSNNAEILKDEKVSNEEVFATSEVVSTFIQKTQTEPVVLENNNTKTPNKDLIFDVEYSAPVEEEIKYVNYVNFKNTDSYKYSKKLALNMLFKNLTTSGIMLLILAICSTVTAFTGTSALYYIFFITSIIFTIFYPILFAINMQKFRIKHQTDTYKNNFHIKLYLSIALILVVLITTIIVNIATGNNTIGLILNFNNFENLYAPLLMSSIVLLDLIPNKIFITKLLK